MSAERSMVSKIKWQRPIRVGFLRVTSRTEFVGLLRGIHSFEQIERTEKNHTLWFCTERVFAFRNVVKRICVLDVDWFCYEDMRLIIWRSSRPNV